MQTYVIRRYRRASRGTIVSSIGLPERVAESFEHGQRFEVTQEYDEARGWRIVLTPVRNEFQPPGTREPGSRR